MEKVLTAVCRECRNYFVRTIERGTLTISGGVIAVQGEYLVGQYIRLIGSVLNDGIYKVKDNPITLDGATDEVFTGIMCGLSIPADFLVLVDEVKAFQEGAAKNPNTGVVSESFGGYAYSLATGANGMPATWIGVFSAKLGKFRKMYDEVML